MHAEKNKNKKVEDQPVSPKAFRDLDLQKSFCLRSEGLGLKCPLSPPSAPPLYVELPVCFQYTGNYKHPSPPKDIRHWWLLLVNVSSLTVFLLRRYIRYTCTRV